MKHHLTPASRVKDLGIFRLNLVLHELFGIPDAQLLDGEKAVAADTVQDIIDFTGLSEEKVLLRLERFLEMSDDIEISCESLKCKLTESTDTPVLLDVREEWEFEKVHISGSLLLKNIDLAVLLDEIRKSNQEVVTVCHHGVRSFQAAMYLRQQGIGRVRSLEGGVDKWAIDIDPSLTRY